MWKGCVPCFPKKEEKQIKKFVRELYSDIPNMDNKEWKEVEKWGLGLWQEYLNKKP